MLCTDIQYMVCVQHTVVCCMVYATYGSIYICVHHVYDMSYICVCLWYHAMHDIMVCVYIPIWYVCPYLCMHVCILYTR